jgi:2-polyprenyl-3-methyl-5-hydroxy-6-metoxy-1,4-benzoquinol methylase
LDIGCAAGQLLSFFKTKDWKTAGIDPDETSRKHAKTNFGLNVFEEDYLNLIPPKSFDVISMWHVLEHVSRLSNQMKDLKN